MSIRGIDVSYFQGTIDWEAVKNSGIEFAMLRAGYGAGNIDRQFKRNAEECNRIGIPFGVYWFSYAFTEAGARQEAEYCIQAIREFKVQYPVAFDYETASVDYAGDNGVNVTPSLATSIVNAFCRRVEELGYFAMYYSNQYFLDRMFDDSLRSKYALWYAKYASSPGMDQVAMWQSGDSGRVPGITGNVDLDIDYDNLAAVIEKAGLNHLKEEVSPPAPAPSPDKAVVYTVRYGDSLSGIAARFGTTWKVLAAYNGITNPNRIYAGQKIRIPIESGKTYIIKPGDTLSGIAARFGTTVQELQRLNGIQNANRIYVGQVIRIN